jgi:hypothetical protein
VGLRNDHARKFLPPSLVMTLRAGQIDLPHSLEEQVTPSRKVLL